MITTEIKISEKMIKVVKNPEYQQKMEVDEDTKKMPTTDSVKPKENLDDKVKHEEDMDTAMETKMKVEVEEASENVPTNDSAKTEENVDSMVKREENIDTTIDNKELEDGRNKSLNLSHLKVMIHNVNKYWNSAKVEKMLNSALCEHGKAEQLKIIKSKKPPTKTWIKVQLEKEEMVKPFIDFVNVDMNGGEHVDIEKVLKRNSGRRRNTKNQPLVACVANDGEKDENLKRDRGENGDENSNKRSKTTSHVFDKLTEDEIRDKMTPLWRMTYEEQLQHKWREMIKKSIHKITSEVNRIFKVREKEIRRNKNMKKFEKFEWLSSAKTKMPIRLEPILPSPYTTQYRNKVELTFGYAFEEKDDDPKRSVPIVGFTPQGWKGPVYKPHCCQNVPKVISLLSDVVNNFLKDSPIPPYNSFQHLGVWRTLTIRFSKRTEQIMLIVVHAPPASQAGSKDQNTSENQVSSNDYSSVWESEKKRLIDMLTSQEFILDDPSHKEEPWNPSSTSSDVVGKLPTKSSLISYPNYENSNGEGKSKVVKVTSIYFQEYAGLSNPTPSHPVQHSYGEQGIVENLGACKFKVSPGAFFQVNTPGAEVLYNVVVQKVREVVKDDEENKVLLLDVCCGTGTIGLTCVKENVSRHVLGVDISEPAIRDADKNAVLNGFANNSDASENGESTNNRVRFVASRAEAVLAKELNKCQGDPKEQIVAVVDPAREGLHSDVIKTLRVNESIQRLIYVSCNPTGSLVKDAGLLLQPPTKKYQGLPFKPTFAQPVDMFPMTDHCELVIVFDRMTHGECFGSERTKNEDEEKER